MLNFQPLTLGMKPLVDSYTFKYGEGSCQHSFVSSWCLRHKYGDMFCENEGYLYTLRSAKCTENCRVYLFPHGDRADSEALRRAVQNVIDDAHGHEARVRFETLTQSAKDIVCSLFPGRFSAESSEDYTEYVYSIDRQEDLSRWGLRNRRQKINRFFRDYGDRCEILRIEKEHIPLIREYQASWLKYKLESQERSQHYIDAITTDNAAIQVALDNFFELGLFGIVLFIDGKVSGYEYGSRLSESYCDSMEEKGDTSIRSICRVLNQEFINMCCHGMHYINVEEDVGIEGIREKKHFDRPDIMIEKFIVQEV
ncbi:MAG: hypothetical protein IJS28_04860 [Synergistaceae bacterium]|nr:hypothetical protein [Synergistaceae bacterium]